MSNDTPTFDYLVIGGATTAGELYRRTLDKCTPGGAVIEVACPSHAAFSS